MLKFFKRAFTNYKNKDANLKKQGNKYLASGNLIKAEECYRQYIDNQPNDAEGYLNLGYVLSEQQKYDSAEPFLLKSVALAPTNADGFYLLGVMYEKNGSLEKAIHYYELALQANPLLEIVYHQLYQIYTKNQHASTVRAIFTDSANKNPGCALAKYYIGCVCLAENSIDEALCFLDSAVIIEPNNELIHFQIGNAYKQKKQDALAINSYQNAISINPDFVDSYNNLALMLMESNSLDDAELYANKSIKIDSKNPESLYVLGLIYHKKHLPSKAIDSFKSAVHFCKNADLFVRLAAVLFDLDKSEAMKCLHGAYSIKPDDQYIKYIIDGLEGNHQPDASPGRYIKTIFDSYADTFDKHLVAALEYRSPQDLVALLHQEINLALQRWDVLDLGCGTGLVGQAIAPYSHQLVGVDLSMKMLDKARDRGLYTRLENAELVSMMHGERESSYDIVIATDVFIYVGKLDDTFSEVKRLLKSIGYFAFTVEALEHRVEVNVHQINQQDFRLDATLRYAHASGYIERLAQLHGFKVRKRVSAEIRKESGVSIVGWYFICELAK